MSKNNRRKRKKTMFENFKAASEQMTSEYQEFLNSDIPSLRASIRSKDTFIFNLKMIISSFKKEIAILKKEKNNNQYKKDLAKVINARFDYLKYQKNHCINVNVINQIECEMNFLINLK